MRPFAQGSVVVCVFRRHKRPVNMAVGAAESMSRQIRALGSAVFQSATVWPLASSLWVSISTTAGRRWTGRG